MLKLLRQDNGIQMHRYKGTIFVMNRAGGCIEWLNAIEASDAFTAWYAQRFAMRIDGLKHMGTMLIEDFFSAIPH